MACLLTVAGQAAAQDAVSVTATAQTPDTVTQVDEIVVTAQKRTERLVEVPLAVTAVSGETLDRQQINDSASLVRAVPSLTYQAGNNPSNSGFRIRGVGTALFGQGVEPAVAVVVDGVVAARSAQGFQDLADIERVEVLRGPQGTLFGKNATAGVVSIVTARPSHTFGGRVDATMAEQGEYRIKGTVTGPISETLSGRLSGFYNDVDGNLKNVATGNDTNGFSSWGLRGKLDWQATEALNFLLIAEHRDTDSNCCSRVPISVTTPALLTLMPGVTPSRDNRKVSNDDLSFTRSNASTVSLQADYDLGFATVTGITAYQRYESTDLFEPDQIVSNPVRYVGPSAYSQWNSNEFGYNYDQFSQEVRLSSNGQSDLTYVVGAYYANFDMDRGGSRRRARCGSGTLGAVCTVPLTYDSSGFTANFKSESAAVFGQADYRLTGGLHVLGGLRYATETQEVTGRRYAPVVAGDANFPGITNNSGTRSRDDSAVTGKAGVRYEFDRNMQAYATYTKGYKSFALDADAATDYASQTGLNPEHVDAYEIGFKYRRADGKFEVNAALFRSDFVDLQVQSIQSDPTTGVFQAVSMNAGKSRSQGMEIETVFRPFEGFTLGANLTLLDASVDVDGQTCALQNQAAAQTYSANFPTNLCYRKSAVVNGNTQVSSPLIDVRGGDLPAAPDVRFSLSPRYERDFVGAGLTGFAQLNVSYTSAQTFALEQDPLRTQDAYTMVDASVGLGDIGGKYMVTLFVKNLFDETYFTQLNHGTILATAASPNDIWANVSKDANRYVGINLSARF